MTYGLSSRVHKTFVFVATFLLWSTAFAEEMKIVAVVNDEVITQTELDRALAPVYLQLRDSMQPEEMAAKAKEIKEKVLQQLIEERLMLQEARNPKPVEVSKGKIGTPPPVTVSDVEMEELVKQAAARFETPEAFHLALSEQGITLEDLKSRYRDEITVQKLIGREIHSRVSVSPAEVTAYYRSHPQEFQTPAAVQVALILIKPQSSQDNSRAAGQVQDLYRQLTQGADFYELAKRYSDGPNAAMGGRIGFLDQGKGRKEIDGVLFKLKAGEVSPVIQTPIGFHVFRIESIRSSRQAQLEEAKNQIQDRLFQQKSTARYKEWIAKLKMDAYISVP